MKKLAGNLKLIRKKRWGMSQDKFAELMKSSRSKINSYENGGVEPSIAFMVQLQAFTGISVKDIFSAELQLEKVPPVPLSQESKNVVLFEDEKQDYDNNSLAHLKNYDNQMSKRFKSIEDRIEKLESNKKSKN